jgi:hypothetical protein
MKITKIIAGLAIAGGLAGGAIGIGEGTASADPGIAPIPTRWGPPPPPPWNDNGWGWGGPGPGWNGGYGDGPIPGGWNGGWEPQGGICIWVFCA